MALCTQYASHMASSPRTWSVSTRHRFCKDCSIFTIRALSTETSRAPTSSPPRTAKSSSQTLEFRRAHSQAGKTRKHRSLVLPTGWHQKSFNFPAPVLRLIFGVLAAQSLSYCRAGRRIIILQLCPRFLPLLMMTIRHCLRAFHRFAPRAPLFSAWDTYD